jgi:poly(3-hydroxybutyrate) depolymerase
MRCLLAVLLLASCAPVGDDDDSAVTPEPTPEDSPTPDWCPSADEFDVRDTDASPYFHQAPDEPDAPTLIFLPGGAGTGGTNGHATRTWDAFFTADLDVLSDWRLVMPYVDSGSFTEEITRAHEVVDEIRTCFGADVVHLGGSSNGGNGAFTLMLDDSSRYSNVATLPGCLGDYDEDAVAEAYTGRRVMNAIGDGDELGWQQCVNASHDFLVAQGIDSTHRVYLGVPHVPPSAWTGIEDLLGFLSE